MTTLLFFGKSVRRQAYVYVPSTLILSYGSDSDRHCNSQLIHLLLGVGLVHVDGQVAVGGVAGQEIREQPQVGLLERLQSRYL